MSRRNEIKANLRGNPSYMGKELPNQPPHSYNGSKNHPHYETPSERRRRRFRERRETPQAWEFFGKGPVNA